MEQKAPEQIKIELPMSQDSWSKKWIVGSGLVVLLIGIIVTSTLIAVYITQKHTEKMVTLAYNGRDGQRIQQIVSVNEQENLAAIFVSSGNDSFTMLYDYRRNIIGIRQKNSSACYVLGMDKSQTPSIRDIIGQMEHMEQDLSSDEETPYNITPEKKANPTDVGMSVNILCSDVAIYWAKLINPGEARRRKWYKKPKFNIDITFGRK